MAIPRYSANPPIVAPIRFAPKQDDAFLLSRKVVEKIRPAKKTGKGTNMRTHTNRRKKGNPNMKLFGVKYNRIIDAIKGRKK